VTGKKKKTVRRRAKPSEFASSQSDPVVHVNKAPCSVEFARNAKGQASWTLKVYGERDDLDECLDQIFELDEKIRERTSEQ